jgi:hypothetical protein
VSLIAAAVNAPATSTPEAASAARTFFTLGCSFLSGGLQRALLLLTVRMHPGREAGLSRA